VGTRFPVAERWFSVVSIDDTITLVREPHVDPLLRCNIWHVRGRDRDLVVDTGLGVASLRAEVARLRERPVAAVITHRHHDHAGGLAEFDERVAHGAEPAPPATHVPAPLRADELDPGWARALGGYDVGEWLLTAVPHDGFDPRGFRQPVAAPTRVVVEGDVVDLGDRSFEVLHLPGHSPGSIGLWDPAHGVLFSGDAIYDGPLLDSLPGADLDAYTCTMRRLRALPVEVVHGGHDESFGRSRLHELVDTWLRERGR
jgi:glyoxylase-like metal-dependent hydrolase (beta-lactamase superfamily II)